MTITEDRDVYPYPPLQNFGLICQTIWKKMLNDHQYMLKAVQI